MPGGGSRPPRRPGQRRHRRRRTGSKPRAGTPEPAWYDRFVNLDRFEGVRRFIRESWSEIQKVIWPDRETTRNLTLVVIAVSIVLGILLGGIDYVLFQFSRRFRSAGCNVNQDHEGGSDGAPVAQGTTRKPAKIRARRTGSRQARATGTPSTRIPGTRTRSRRPSRARSRRVTSATACTNSWCRHVKRSRSGMASATPSSANCFPAMSGCGWCSTTKPGTKFGIRPA